MIRFLGGIYFAIILIATAACFVITGTIIESVTDSHQYAAYFTYNNPLFTGLLALFFVNILVSALRRWPFQKKHIPFLITHFGLLMILSGVITKNIWGVQGTLAIWEGSGSHELILNNTFGVEIEEKATKQKKQFALNELDVVWSTPHAEKQYESWIKDDSLSILGLPKIPLNQKTLVRIHGPKSNPWSVYACKSDDVAATAKKLYEEGLRITVQDRLHKKRLEPETILVDIAAPSLTIQHGTNKASLDLKNLSLTNHTTPYIGSPPFNINLRRKPLLAFIQDPEKNIHFFAFDVHGRIHTQLFSATSWSTLIVYDEGYEGYAVQAKIPFQEKMPTRSEIENVATLQLKQALDNATSPLSPPLELLKHACTEQNKQFTDVCLSFLKHWDNTHHWIYPSNQKLPKSLKPIFEHLPWEAISRQELNALKWIATLVPPIEQELINGGDLFTILKKRKWPFVNQIPNNPPQETGPLLTKLAQQILSVADYLPEADPITNQASIFSAYLRAYGIHLSEILPEIPFEPQTTPTLESLVALKPLPLPPQRKLEENKPAITLKHNNELITLGYDPHNDNLHWPTQSGKHLLHFGPLKLPIPYHVRVREARQINYAHSNQPYSYECDVLINNLTETTLSMNQVHETWDGYRFYLASINPSNPGETHQVRIVVNRDPAKYVLTYPGALILSLGILLLFWVRKKL